MMADSMLLLQTNIVTIALVALGLALLAFCTGSIALVALRRLRQLQQRTAELGRELAAFEDASIGIGRALARPVLRGETAPRAALSLAAKQAEAVVVERVDSAPRTAPRAAPGGNDRALQLARGGASIDELVSSCDLSRGEASLVLALARRDRFALVG